MRSWLPIILILGVLLALPSFAANPDDVAQGATTIIRARVYGDESYTGQWGYGNQLIEFDDDDFGVASAFDSKDSKWIIDLEAIPGTSPDTGMVWVDPVIDKDLNTPPGGESEGDRYIVAAQTDWYKPEFAYRRTITTDSSKVIDDETDSVVSYQFTSTGDDLWSHAQSDGEDILFCDTDAVTKLDHSLEWYNSTDERLIVQIEIPTLDKDANQSFYMYYGDTDAPAQENHEGTYPSDYHIFYDMRPPVASGEDRTQYHNDPYGEVGDPAPGQDDYGRYEAFDGNDAWNLRGIEYLYDEYDTRTFNVIFKTSATLTGTQTLFAHGGTTNGAVIYMHHDGSGAQIWCGWWSRTNGWAGDWLTSDTTAPGIDASGYVSASTLYYVSAVYDAPSGLYQLFVNGVEQDADAGHTATNTIAAATGRGGIAYSGPQNKRYNGAGAGGNYFTGDVYEFAAIEAAWSEDYHDTWYNHQSDNAAFWTTGAEADQTGASGDWAGHENDIAEYNSEGGWDWTTAVDGLCTWVKDEDRHYVYNGTAGTWEILLGDGDYEVLSHEALSNIQGGSYGPPVEHYHMTAYEHAQATRIASDTQTGIMPAGKLSIWDLGYFWRLEGINTDSGAVTPEDAWFTVAGGTDVSTSGSGSTVTVEFTGVSTDEKVGVDSGATPDYLGAAASDGALRATLTDGITWADGGDYITLGLDVIYNDVSGNDGATDVTAEELEELTDGSETTLHSHADSDTVWRVYGFGLLQAPAGTSTWMTVNGVSTANGASDEARVGYVVARNCTIAVTTMSQSSDLIAGGGADDWNVEVWVDNSEVMHIDVEDGSNEFEYYNVSDTSYTVNAGQELAVLCEWTAGGNDLTNVIVVLELKET